MPVGEKAAVSGSRRDTNITFLCPCRRLSPPEDSLEEMNHHQANTANQQHRQQGNPGPLGLEVGNQQVPVAPELKNHRGSVPFANWCGGEFKRVSQKHTGGPVVWSVKWAIKTTGLSAPMAESERRNYERLQKLLCGYPSFEREGRKQRPR